VEGESVQARLKSISKPAVSIIVPAYNCDRQIPKCLTSIFESAAGYMGFCEVIVVDDGSSDHTYEMAWATIKECRRRWPQISGKVVRHTARLGENQALKTGVNKAYGTLIVVVNPQISWKPGTLKDLVEAIEKHGRASSSPFAAIYRADALRRTLWKT